MSDTNTNQVNISEKSITIAILNWLSGQPFNNVLLLAIFTAIGWGAHYAMTVAVPSHLKQIQEGYKAVISDVHSKHESERASLQMERERIIETYDKWFDRIEKRDSNVAKSTPNNE